MSHKHPENPEPFGQQIGMAPGEVPVFSSYYASLKAEDMPDRDEFKHIYDGVVTGYKWQCVELARRWLYVNRRYVFEDVPMAYEIFGIKHFKTLPDNRLLPARSFKNGSRRPPEEGCLLIWNEKGEFEITGHVAVITEVRPESVRIVEQNVEHTLWGDKSWARELPMRKDSNGRYFVTCTYTDTSILGWVIQTEDDKHSVKPTELSKTLFHFIPHKIAERSDPWLNVQDAVQKAFVEAMGQHSLVSNKTNQGRYYFISATAEDEIRKATNELHRMFLNATDYIINHPRLLERFNFPPALIPRIERSWHNRKNESIMGRFDFSMTENGLKVFEYNLDSAGCQVECGLIQGLWAKANNICEGRDSGAELYANLVETWKELGSSRLIHILQDDDPEETYLAEFVKSSLLEAGYHVKVIKGFAPDMTWNEQAHVLDINNIPIKEVWKSWAWETAIDQLRNEEVDEAAFLNNKDRLHKFPALVDILLNKEVMVYEPLWSVIPSNKAILPVLWRLYPKHRYLLESHYVLTSRLRKKGYVKKPIVGRCGSNIKIIAKNEKTIAATGGQFGNQDSVYQALCSLPQIEGQNIQLCSFTVGGVYAGACVRSDTSLIIQSQSDVVPLRVLDDSDYLCYIIPSEQ